MSLSSENALVGTLNLRTADRTPLGATDVLPQNNNIHCHLTPVEFHVTGFMRFFNVPINPTEHIVHELPRYLEKFPLASNACLSSAVVLQVAAKTVSEQLDKMYASLSKQNGVVGTASSMRLETGPSDSEKRTVFIHLGVNTGCTQFYLEWKAKNEATFSCPDELGWVPVKHAIDPDNDDITCTRQTSLMLHPLVDRLAQLGYSVGISKDAGRFVCNWTYFNSLKLADTYGSHALFVHVPPASLVPIDKQVQFVVALLNTIAQMPV